MTKEEFIYELDVQVQKPKLAVLPFIWRILKEWMAKNADLLLFLISQLVLTRSDNPEVRKLLKQIIALLKPKN